MPEPTDEITPTTVWCPRCDRKYDSKKTRVASLELLSEHVDEAHPDMDNYIREDDI